MTRRRRACPTCGTDLRARDLGRVLAALARAQAALAVAVDGIWAYLAHGAHHRARGVRR
jgi:hypothetical protein